ncbi:MAG: hypothetical protein HFE43_09830 [Oscillospiraceae bacterium]|nr:hypothetical protein [Oscillospiraceae bacterium]
MKMETESLASSLHNSITNESLSICTNILEVGLDALIGADIWKDIPFLSTAVSMYKIGHSIKECYELKKLAAFLEEINKGCIGSGKLKERRKKFEEDIQFRN